MLDIEEQLFDTERRSSTDSWIGRYGYLSRLGRSADVDWQPQRLRSWSLESLPWY